MVSCYKWTYKNRDIDSELFLRIKEVTGSGIIAGLLINRGITTPEEAKAFLNPSEIKISPPDVFEDMPKAVNRIFEAIKKQERVIIYGDFDADGVTSTSLLYKALKHIGANVGYFIPDRMDEGHGLNKAAVCRLISQEKAKLIITVDCGISNVAEVKLAESLGTRVIITDHHEAPEILPAAFATINPKLLDNDPTGLKYLAGAGVALKLAQALLEHAGKPEYLEELIHIAAIGTVGDVVPLLGENRAIVHKGLELISSKKPANIAKLMEIAGYKPDKKVTSSMIAFGIVPRLNAVGRLAGANPAVEFLVSDDTGEELSEKLELLIDELERSNKERQQICDETFKQAVYKIKQEVDLDRDKALILADTGWHSGIVGIAASRLVETYHRPALLIAIDENAREGRCSARSVPGLNLFETLSKFSDYFVQFGGHALAAGFTFSLDKISFADLRRKLLNHINSVLDSNDLKPEIKLDMDIETADLTPAFINELDRLAPYGEANPYPLFGIPNMTLRSCAPMGQKKNHLRIMLSDNKSNMVEAVWWQRDNLDISVSEQVDVAFVPTMNNFRDRETIQLVLKDIRRVADRNLDKICASSCDIPDEELFDEEELRFDKPDCVINWIDHRQETGLKRDFLEYLKSLGNKVSVFAESMRAKEILGNLSFLLPCIVDRENVKKSDYLVLLDIPADDVTFMNVIKQVAPQEVHLFGIMNDHDPVNLIKKISGMLKYAYKEKDGVIAPAKVAATLGIPEDLLLACIELLDSASVVEILEISSEAINFEFIGSVNFASIQELDEYDNFLNVLNEFENYKKEYKTRDIELVKQTINNCCVLTEV